MTVAAPRPYSTSEAYLDWEPLQIIGYECIDGEVFAMTSGSLPHSKIASVTTLDS